MEALFKKQEAITTSIIDNFQNGRKLSFFKGLRPTLPSSVFPSFEIGITSASNEWFATHTQKPTFPFRCLVTVSCPKIDVGEEYITTLTTYLVGILTDPRHIQIPIIGASVWNHDGATLQAKIMDAFVPSIDYSSTKEGTVRVADFTWEVKVLEPYPEDFWHFGSKETSGIPTRTVGG